MTRDELLADLLADRGSIPELRRELAKLPWDSRELVVLRPEHAIAVIDRFLDGKRDASQVSEWANAIEGRDDVGLDGNSGGALRDLIFETANPELEGPLTRERATDWRERLRALGSRDIPER
jgi:hypothetical protein